MSDSMAAPTRGDIVAIAVADAFRGDGEILASPIGWMPQIGAKLARRTFAPDLMMSDGIASLMTLDGEAEGWMPYRRIFDLLWSGRRHVMMGASQLDRYGNQNISCIGDHARPKTMLIGARGAPGNTINHTTSYFVESHSPRVFVEQVDFVCGVGYDRAAALGPQASRFHELRRVITDLAVLDFEGQEGVPRMRVRSVHPGVTVEQVQAATGFELVVPAEVPETRAPTAAEQALLDEVVDPRRVRDRVVPTPAPVDQAGGN